MNMEYTKMSVVLMKIDFNILKAIYYNFRFIIYIDKKYLR